VSTWVSARRALIIFSLCLGVACLSGTGAAPAAAGKQTFSRTRAPERVRGALTFQERVAYQYAIEEVYWRHRIWPKQNPGSKPPLDAVISLEEVERKVSDYLRKSQLLRDEWQRPITPSELQTEMERMASHSKKPDVLIELFAALGNDAFVIAECLARPVLVERFVSNLSNQANRSDDSPSRPVLELPDTARATVVPYQVGDAYKLPEISAPLDCADDSWSATGIVNAPEARDFHTAVWTGSEMIIWGGSNSDGGHVNSLNSGGRYSPSTDSWAAMAIANAPLGRASHTAVWTGSEMIIWGGYNYPAGELNGGGIYSPATDSWTATSTTNAPTPREAHTAAWTGSEVIVWGGRNFSVWMNSGGRYDPSTDSWTATTTINAPEARWNHTAVWSGSQMIVWGGTNQTIYLNSGGKYNPSADSWTATGTVNAPLGRVYHTAVWTGSEMIVWGGVDETFNDTNTGGRYNPSTDSWIATSDTNAPFRRDSHTAVWTGSEMIVWGGYYYPPGGDWNTGGRYNPARDSWTPTTTANAPLPREEHTAVWTGNQMIVWGGWSVDLVEFLNTGGRYCAQSPLMAQSAFSRKTHGAVGTFDVPLPLTGNVGIECRSGGATNDYQMIINFANSVTVGSASVTSGTGSMSSFTVSGPQVTVNLTGVTNVQVITVTLFNVNDATHVGNVPVSMGVLIGDVNGNAVVNASDVALTKSQVGQPVGSSNFREDVNANGLINSVDVALVKSDVGTALP
jgi:N-acetylneuraminic acid mutarotase